MPAPAFFLLEFQRYLLNRTITAPIKSPCFQSFFMLSGCALWQSAQPFVTAKSAARPLT